MEISNDLKDGYHVIDLENGNKYEGEIKNCKRNGKGTQTYATGDKYEGNWEDDFENGKGIFFFAHGDKYEGDWKKGKKHGRGIFIFSTGDTYEGDWKDDFQTGFGTFNYTSGNKYEGQCDNGNIEGKGKWTYANGDIYEGDWKDNETDGYGTYTYVDGDRYEGEWKHNLQNGNGKAISVNGDIYEGNWENGKRKGKGKGKSTYADGTKYEGDWENSQRNGKGTFTYANGDKYEGDWEDGETNGKGTYTWANGIKFEGEFSGDKITGEGIFSWVNGDTFEGSFESLDYEFINCSIKGKGKLVLNSGKIITGGLDDFYLEFKAHDGSFNAQSILDSWNMNNEDEKLAHVIVDELHEHFHIDITIFPKEDLKFIKQLGKGILGKVFLATHNSSQVAIRQIENFEKPYCKLALKNLRIQIELMMNLKNPCLVACKGMYFEGNELCIVTEYCQGGSLLDLINSKSFALSIKQKVKILYDLATGIYHIHNGKKIHRDIKPANIFLDQIVENAESKISVKLSDFGLIQATGNEALHSRLTRQSCDPWIAPEIFKAEEFGSESDIYAFGIIMWEVFASKIAYSDLSTNTHITHQVCYGELRPNLNDLPEDTPEDAIKLMESCWEDDPLKRPEISEVIDVMKNLGSLVGLLEKKAD